MATLQKFKLFATQFAVIGTPTTSTAINLRRRKTLRLLLGSSGCVGGTSLQPCHDEASPDRGDSSDEDSSPERGEDLIISRKLKDLFVSSPPAVGDRISDNASDAAGLALPLKVGSSIRPFSATLRQRLLRRAWRPVLIGIPE